VLVVAALGLTFIFTVAAVGRSVRAHQAFAQQCKQPYPKHRARMNPLALKTAPGKDRLTGAHFFVDGPAHGQAAAAIEQLLGLNPSSFATNYSWAKFASRLAPGGDLNTSKLMGDPALAHKVALLSKIASEPEPQTFNTHSRGGDPSALFAQVQKLMCENLKADPHSILIATTGFIHPESGCPDASALDQGKSAFDKQVSALAQGIGRRPALVLMEPGQAYTATCLSKSALSVWESDLRYEVGKLMAEPHTVVYIDAGGADETSPAFTAKLLNGGGVRSASGFFVNAGQYDWTKTELVFAANVSKHTHGAHFLVNTALNGRGPARVKPGKPTENLCNPPGRGLGPRPTADTGAKHADAFVWTAVPGRSKGSSCHHGDLPPGEFEVSLALELAGNASSQLGPGPAKPY
jgi:hypothetical protein